MKAFRAAHLSRSTMALLVDRDVDSRQMYAEFLRHSAFDVEEAVDGREALAKALTLHPDVVVTETRLPGINGFDLCSLLRSDRTTHDIPILVVTGDAFAPDIERALASGADAVLTKPCLPDVLGTEIRTLLSQSQELRERARELRTRASASTQQSSQLLDRAKAQAAKRQMLSRSHQRHDTTEPPLAPPHLRCPTCDGTLKYLRSHIGGVSIKHPEQWDYFECPNACGTFQFRHRTRRVRRTA